MHRDQRLAGGQRQPLGKIDPYQQSPHQPRGIGYRHGVHGVQGDSRLFQCLGGDAGYCLRMTAAGDFRNYAAVQPVLLHLGSHHAGQRPTPGPALPRLRFRHRRIPGPKCTCRFPSFSWEWHTKQPGRRSASAAGRKRSAFARHAALHSKHRTLMRSRKIQSSHREYSRASSRGAE